jgi:hypothetical protein
VGTADKVSKEGTPERSAASGARGRSRPRPRWSSGPLTSRPNSWPSRPGGPRPGQTAPRGEGQESGG